MLKETTRQELGNELKSGTKLLVFHATWCAPCRMYKNSLIELSEKNGIEVYRVDIDKDKDFALDMGVQSIPATFVYKDGEKVKNFLGYRPYEQLVEELKTL
ncbi:thioredoxin [Mycoplasmopsis anatis]|uniref:Thioredoxin n=1 Tax=Mycoplasmopsis anatis TaxID=171279 RepID=A0A9Q3L8A2_9BACT|nr:thioredoxin family protein [Mycoplasmopsis anatis]MBW0594660.1 thioredoxin [Mycoplasmopsis anatis]MBW0595078.1 thioredoxin [Mycoplasmopsis anatis]MBW0596004.1 thioredoxin [Mycoplasmopsis anatis]MBW0596577.1 thioredoxin [Mycoplasmopsis anatis]MBW0597479.1 thioredoxin [Mycoplasmopsis anatis]